MSIHACLRLWSCQLACDVLHYLFILQHWSIYISLTTSCSWCGRSCAVPHRSQHFRKVGEWSVICKSAKSMNAMGPYYFMNKDKPTKKKQRRWVYIRISVPNTWRFENNTQWTSSSDSKLNPKLEFWFLKLEGVFIGWELLRCCGKVMPH